MIRHLLQWFTDRPASVSSEWLRDQERQSSRVEFVGVRWAWPVKKQANESGRWNAKRLKARRSA